MAVSETLQLILKMESGQAEKSLKNMGGLADAAAKDFDVLTQKIALQGRALALAQRELDGLQKLQGAASAKARSLAADLEKVAAAEGRDSAEAQKLATQLEHTSSAADKLALAVERKSIAIERGRASMQQLGREAQTTGAALQDQAGKAAQSGGQFDSLAGKLMDLGKGYLALSTVTAVVDWGKQGAAIQGVTDSFDKLAAGAGTTGDALLAAMQKASRGTIADSELMAKANQAVLLSQGRFATELPRLLEGARASAKATGKDVSKAFDDIVTAAARGSAEIADNLGFTVNAAQANKDYAASLGISVDALTNQQKQTAFTNALLVQSDGLVKTLGDSTLSSADKIAQAETKWKNFADTLKVKVADGLGAAADGVTYLQQLMAGNGGGDVQAQALAVTAQSYEQYVAAITSGNQAFKDSNAEMQRFGSYLGPFGALITVAAQAQAALVGETEIMSKAQFTAGQELQNLGYSAEQASAMVAGLSGQQTILAAITGAVTRETELDAAAKQALIDRLAALASSSPAAILAMAGLIQQFVTGKISAEELQGGLSVLEIRFGSNSAAVLEMADSLLVAASATFDSTDAAAEFTAYLDGQTDAAYATASASIEASIQQEILAQATDNAASAAANNIGLLAGETDSLYDMAAAAKAAGDMLTYKALAAAAGGMSRNTAAGRAELKAQGIDPRDQVAYKNAVASRAQEIVDPSIQRRADAAADSYNRTNSANIRRDRQRASESSRASRGGRSGRAGGAGGAGAGRAGTSPEVKQREKDQKELSQAEDKIQKIQADYRQKSEKATADHVGKVGKIWTDFYQKQLADEQKFNSDKFQSRLSFQDSLKNVDQDTRDQMLAAERQAWDESQKIAQEGNPKLAQEYYEQRLAQIGEANARAEEIKAKEKEITEAESAEQAARLQQDLAYLQQLDAQHKQYDQEALDKLKAGGNENAIERDEQLAEENSAYAQAQDQLKTDFAASIQTVVDGAGTMGDAVKQIADTVIAAAGLAADAIRSIPPMPSSASGAPASEAPQGSYATGTGDRGLPRTGPFIGHASEIILNGRQSEMLRRAGGVRALDQGRLGATGGRSSAIPSGPERRALAMQAPRAGVSSTAMMGAGSRSSSTVNNGGAVNIAPGAIIIQAGNANPAQIADLVDQRLKKFTRETGGSAASRRKMGA